jgi:carbon-monoxide dehydrogenase large subunit
MIGARVARSEDPRFLRGRGTFVDDVRPAGLLHAAVLRSPHARAAILRVDAARARHLPGVHLVLTAGDLGELNRPGPLLIPHPALAHPRTQRPLAVDAVRFVGEAVAFVVADSRYLAEDAAALIEVVYEPHPAVVDAEAALDPNAPRVHRDVADYRAAHFPQVVGDPEGAFRRAAHILRERLVIERSCGSPIEGRGVVAEHDARGGLLRVWDSTQAPLTIKNGLARMFGLPEFRVEVIAPDTGGGFGTKIMLFYPEEILVPLAALRLGRPVKWIEDRHEHLLAANQERRQVHHVEVAVDSGGRILALRDRFLHDAGAYTPYGIVVPIITATHLPGPYRLRHYQVEFEVAYTNRVPVSPYRGAGRPHGVFAMERMIGLIARALSLEPAEVRRRNFIQPDEFPWDVGLTFQDGGPTRYDSGNYPAGLDMALDLIGAREFPARQAEARRAGRHLGLGVACFVEGTGIGPYEGAHVRVEPSGKVLVATGLTTQGQGHETTFAQIAAAALGCDLADVTVVTGDSRAFNWGAGTFASRGIVTSGHAIHAAALEVRAKALRLAANLLEAAPADLEIAQGVVRVKGVPGKSLTLGALAGVANPIRYAYGQEAAEAALRLVKPRAGAVLAPGETPGLEASGYHAPAQATFASGCHAAIVEVDVETGEVRLLRYVVQHDCGTIVNPMIVEGQIRGGVAQGIGGALYEKLACDGDGQPLTASYMDFLLPTAMEIPSIEIGHLETPSPLNPLGIKGVGEAGAIPGPALLAEAIDDALAPFGIRIREMPLSPGRLRELIKIGGSEPPLSPMSPTGSNAGLRGRSPRGSAA